MVPRCLFEARFSAAGGACHGSEIECGRAKIRPCQAFRLVGERLGANAKIAPKMDPIGATRRGSLNDEAAREDATAKYLGSTPPTRGRDMVDTPEAGQPKALQRPSQ